MSSCVCFWAATFLCGPLGASPWGSDPYDVTIWYSPTPVADLLAVSGDQLSKKVDQNLKAVLGRAWKIRSKRIYNGDALLDAEGISFADAFAFDNQIIECDKVFVVVTSVEGNSYQIAVRELDCTIQRWGPVQRTMIVQAEQLGGEVARTVLDAFRPIARLNRVQRGSVSLEPRAGMLAMADSPLLVAPGTPLKAMVCKTTAAEDGLTKAVQEVPLTVMTVDAVSADRLQAKLISGLRAPLRTRTARNVERYAVAVPIPFSTTTLVLRDSQNTMVPLVGYDVYRKRSGAKRTERIGRSNHQGKLMLARSGQAVSTYYIKHGKRVLAKIPLVVGSVPEVVIQLADDSLRLSAEGFLQGIEERLLDAVVKREIAAHRAKATDNPDRIEEFITEVHKDDLRRELLRLVQSKQPEFRSSDRRTQSRIDRMFSKTRGSIQEALNPEIARRLEVEIRDATARNAPLGSPAAESAGN